MDATTQTALLSLVFTAGFLWVAALGRGCRRPRCTLPLGFALVLLVLTLVALVTYAVASGRIAPSELPVWVTKGLGSLLGLSVAAAAVSYLGALLRSEEGGQPPRSQG
ncbi:hypothetical protein [Oceanithermus desulfurans]|uniref:Uncharacterized protein n=2 Tax=Oceanithermus desulfurans TaxID=227924 RepID=A0A511RHV9_9DEIN|nr:hypothetical protein [Oceanithermus desulfurans]MBB6029118.1 hypothetical protein [Oceanithermus desulfurans]GEM89244.1 hypothetical protein ODE01S_06780 [Oceanithermus desulfurans NBRC 100063]